MNPILERAEKRRHRALEIIKELDLIKSWMRFGKPVIVGSVSYGLVVAPDIDLEIYSDAPQIRQGFEMIGGIIDSDRIVGLKYTNYLKTKFDWIFWEILYRDKNRINWTIEMYFCGPNDPYAHLSEELADAMKRVLNDKNRTAILSIKEALLKQGINDDFKSTDIYRAVLDDGINTATDFLEWIKTNKSTAITRWVPRAST